MEVAARDAGAARERRRLIDLLVCEAEMAATQIEKSVGDSEAGNEGRADNGATYKEGAGKGGIPLEKPTLKTIYLGGGTPSLLSPGELAPLFEKLRARFAWDENIEITLEANPATTLPENLSGYHALGINRLSLGIQTFDPDGLKTLGRAHTADQASTAIASARSAGFTRISGDLIYGWPGQSLAQLRRDFDTLAATHRLTHISTYSLTIHEGTAFGRRQAEGRLILPPEERVIEMLQELRTWGRAAGLEPYEIGNMGAPGEESRHNGAYWSFKQMIPLGPSACGYLRDRRLANPRSLKQWASAIEGHNLAWEWEEPLEGRARWAEYMLCGLRRNTGISFTEATEQLGIDLRREYRDEITRLVDRGWIELSSDRLRIAEAGIIWADSIAQEFF